MPVSVDEKIFEFIFRVSMGDATNQKAYKGDKNWLKDITNFQTAPAKIKDFILKILNGGFSNQAQYDNELFCVLKDICDEINRYKNTQGLTNPDFTFGHAQKLINMMIKHFFFKSYLDPTLKRNFQYCHCPLDGIMREKIYDEYHKLQANNNRKGIVINGHNYTSKTNFMSVPWSQLDFDAKGYPDIYLDYQAMVRQVSSNYNGQQYSPIELDYVLW